MTKFAMVMLVGVSALTLGACARSGHFYDSHGVSHIIMDGSPSSVSHGNNSHDHGDNHDDDGTGGGGDDGVDDGDDNGDDGDTGGDTGGDDGGDTGGDDEGSDDGGDGGGDNSDEDDCAGNSNQNPGNSHNCDLPDNNPHS